MLQIDLVQDSHHLPFDTMPMHPYIRPPAKMLGQFSMI